MLLYTPQPQTVNAGLWGKRRSTVGIPSALEYYPGGMMLLEVFMLGKRAMLPWILIGLLLFGACGPEGQRTHESDYVTLTPLPTPSAPVVDEIRVTQTPPSPRADETACQSDLNQPAVSYDVDAVLDWTTSSLHVEETVFYRNDSPQAQREIFFDVENNTDPGSFDLKRVSARSSSSVDDYILEDTRLKIPLEKPILPGCETELLLRFNLTVPEIVDGYWLGHLGYWGRSARQLNLGMWFPLVAAFDAERGWLTPPAHWLGEPFVLRAADFVVEIVVKNAPDTLRVAGPGKLSHPDDQTWRFELAGGREMALSLSSEFRVLSTLTSSGVNVELFYLPDADAESLDTPRHALYTAADALVLYEDLFGPYPHQRLVVVQGDFPDGMEFSGLVFVGDAWFKAWQGVPNDWLTLITAHEVAHQWWYALVGNDQGLYPYLDEALALYCEELFVEHYYPEYLEWWWDFRVNMYEPAGYVDTPIYDFYSPRSYIDSVYLRGALMLQALRDSMGDDVFLAWLRRYADRMRGQIAYPRDFWGALPVDVYTRVQPILSNYLKRSDVLMHVDSIP